MLVYPYIDRQETDYPQKYVCVVRRMDRLKNFGGSLLVKIEINLDVLKLILREQSSDEPFLLLDDAGRIICAAGGTELLDKPGAFENFTDFISERKDLTLFDTISTPNGWRIAALVDRDKTGALLNDETAAFIALISAAFIFASMTAFMVRKSFVTRIKALTENVRKMEAQRFDITIDEKSAGTDEIGILIKGMNSATLTIKHLIEEVYQFKIENAEMELTKNRAELNALHSQINPHFLFNILEVIRMRAAKKKEVETATVIKSLARIFRRALTWDDDLITVEEEMYFVKEYLTIQQYRFDEDLTVDIQIDDAALLCNIPKMSIQNFVENACIHGIENSIPGAKTVSIWSRKQGDTLEITVRDNGKGMPRAVIDSVLDETAGGKDKNIGIRNVIKRMAFYYGANFSVDIQSVPYEKTSILLRVVYDGESEVE
jgi:two-component system sensor histidine kinase YesM